MPKMKTRRSAAKRFKVTGKGKIVHGVSKMSHLLEHESANVKRKRRGYVELSEGNKTKVKRMLAI